MFKFFCIKVYIIYIYVHSTKSAWTSEPVKLIFLKWMDIDKILYFNSLAKARPCTELRKVSLAKRSSSADSPNTYSGIACQFSRGREIEARESRDSQACNLSRTRANFSRIAPDRCTIILQKSNLASTFFKQ